MTLLLVFILNFVISGFNAAAIGYSWNETKHVGGMAHFMNWMGGIMSASGFTWCYMVLLGFLAAAIPAGFFVEGAEGMLLNQEALEAFFNLGYIVIYFPIVGSGIAITIDAWAAFYRRRSLANAAVAGYDTFAMIYNISSGIRHMPSAFEGVGDFFGGDSDGDGIGGLIVIILLAMAILGGIFTTVMIAKITANMVRRDMHYKSLDLAA